MSKSMCSGCRYWEFAERGFGDPGFHYCAKLQTDSLLERKEFCGGKYKKGEITMATIKSYTDLQQSIKLAKILPLESADMYWWYSGKRYYIEAIDDGDFNEEGDIRAWSLAALIELLPSELFLPRHYFLEISKMGDCSTPYEVRYYRFREPLDGADFGRITHISYSSQNLIDACFKMIIHLNELKML